MKYNRHSIRLRSFDYSRSGWYFVTICSQKRFCYFDLYPKLKLIVKRQLKLWVDGNQNFKLDEWVIMPNHVHMIIILKTNVVGAGLAPAQKENEDKLNMRATARVAPTVGRIIGEFKSRCGVEWLKHIKENRINAIGKIWQRNFYEHIIRNERELEKIREYIRLNPVMWDRDRNNPIIFKGSRKRGQN